MKVDRVILAVNNNPKYSGHWNVSAPIWKNNFNIKPTLVFYGTEEEFNSCGFILDGYDYMILPKLSEFSEPNPDWVVTWSLFYGASKFSEDVCMLSGIDQIPLGVEFFNRIEDVKDEKFIVGFYDAYLKYNKNTLGYFNTQTNVMYPSSHLVGTGSMFKKLFEIEDEWVDEVSKVYNNKSLYYLKNKYYASKLWGLDECYASHKISIYENQNEIKYLTFFWDFFHPRRIDLDASTNLRFTDEELFNGYYSEVTCKNVKDKKLLYILKKIRNTKYIS
jgi:hypothetical protein